LSLAGGQQLDVEVLTVGIALKALKVKRFSTFAFGGNNVDFAQIAAWGWSME
jgi:hypothetical protein